MNYLLKKLQNQTMKRFEEIFGVYVPCKEVKTPEPFVEKSDKEKGEKKEKNKENKGEHHDEKKENKKLKEKIETTKEVKTEQTNDNEKV